MLKKGKFQIINKDSQNLSDRKEIDLNDREKYIDFSTIRRHEEFYCYKHMKSRLNQICKDEILSDIVMTGTDIMIKTISKRNDKPLCHQKDCLENPKYSYVRIDNFD